MKGYHYLPKRLGGTQNGIESFKKVYPRMGKIVRITGTYSMKRGGYRVKFFGADGQVWDFYGFAWWYGGQGPRGLAECLRLMGIPEEILQKLTGYDRSLHGDTMNPNSFFLNIC